VSKKAGLPARRAARKEYERAAKRGLPARRQARKEYETARKTKALGEGSRFKAIAKSARLGGAREPEAVAAAAGRKAHGQKTMTRLAVAGKKKKK